MSKGPQPLGYDPNEARDFNTEISKGNIEGHAWQAVLARITSTVGGGVFEDWQSTGGNSNILTITTPETYEIVSTSSDDSAAGTGARTCVVSGLDEDYNPVSQIVTLNGTTPVTVTGTFIRPSQCAVISSGSGMTNAGDITVRTQGQLTNEYVRNFIVAGQSISKDPLITIPAGKTGFIKQSTYFVPKNQDIVARNIFKFFGSETPVNVGLDLPLYQNAVIFPVVAPFQLSEKTDIIFQVASSNAGVELQSIVDFLIVDNDQLGGN